MNLPSAAPSVSTLVAHSSAQATPRTSVHISSKRSQPTTEPDADQVSGILRIRLERLGLSASDTLSQLIQHLPSLYIYGIGTVSGATKSESKNETQMSLFIQSNPNDPPPPPAPRWLLVVESFVRTSTDAATAYLRAELQYDVLDMTIAVALQKFGTELKMALDQLLADTSFGHNEAERSAKIKPSPAPSAIACSLAFQQLGFLSLQPGTTAPHVPVLTPAAPGFGLSSPRPTIQLHLSPRLSSELERAVILGKARSLTVVIKYSEPEAIARETHFLQIAGSHTAPRLFAFFYHSDTDDGQWCIVQSFEGKSLADWQELSVGQKTQLYALMVDMHKKGVAHGDLEPRNVVLQEGRVKVVDFAGVPSRNCKDLAPCGLSVSRLVQRIFAILSDPSPASLLTVTFLSATVLRLADEKLNSYPYKDVPLCWRRLYTDAVLLGALVRLQQVEKEINGRKNELRRALRDLDMAIVVAGAPGEGREGLILRLIALVQADLASLARSADASVDDPPLKRRRVSSPAPSSPLPLPPPYLHRPLAKLSSLPTFLSPKSMPSHCSPFIVRKAALDWPAIEQWSSLDYLRQVAGVGRVVPVEVGNDYTQEGWGQQMMGFDEFLRSLEDVERDLRDDAGIHPYPTSTSTALGSPELPSIMSASTDDTGGPSSRPILYLAQHSLFRQFPSLLRDILIPDLVYSSPSTDGTGKPYEPPATEDGYILNAWFGPGGTKSAAHTDPWWNCYVQVVGSKWIWVAPPSCSSYMSAFGAAPTTTPSARTDVMPASEAAGSAPAEEYMTNTSSLDVTVPPPPLSSSTDWSPKEHSSYPSAFLEHVEPRARQAVLEAGDVLVMPPRWWHAMYGLERSFSVSMWF
ncbi:jumonji domain containing protein [Rhodotorula toruloides]|uniref:Jumonji domain containing protein n=1 Tax=Rhodotorula toruloides TaxID=5286 RepID=A0A511KQE0_RHOTO|nr:jumonji domain containing protein [Rhodotorula toruloides]